MTGKELINMLTVDDIICLLKTLGSTYIDKKEAGHLIFQTVCHGGNKHKLYYYIDSKSFHCYTNCGQMDIFEVVMSVNHMNFYQAKSYICSVLNIDNDIKFEDYKTSLSDDLNILNSLEVVTKQEQPKKLIEYSEVVMNLFVDKYYYGWIQDNITVETMKKFNIKYYPLDQSIIIPHYDIDGRLIGIRRRSLNIEEITQNGKYMPVKIEGKYYSHPLQFNLYGLNFNKEYVKKAKKIVVVEGEKGVMQLDSMYPDGFPAVALSSSNLSNVQVDMILKLGVEEVILSLDRQYEELFSEEYKKYQKKIIKLAKKFTPYVNTSVIWDMDNLLNYKDSPTDKGKEVFEDLYKRRIVL